jgi:hypothetical protein
VPLGTVGMFQFYGKCFTNGSGNVQAVEYVALSSGTAIYSTEDESDSVPYLTPSTPETDRRVEANSGAGTDSVDVENNDADFRATDGSIAITGVIGMAASKQGSPPEGNGPFGAGDACLFGGSVFGG